MPLPTQQLLAPFPPSFLGNLITPWHGFLPTQLPHCWGTHRHSPLPVPSQTFTHARWLSESPLQLSRMPRRKVLKHGLTGTLWVGSLFFPFSVTALLADDRLAAIPRISFPPGTGHRGFKISQGQEVPLWRTARKACKTKEVSSSSLSAFRALYSR